MTTYLHLPVACCFAAVACQVAGPDCRTDGEKRRASAEELQRLVAADQKDRQNADLSPQRDRDRRDRVAAIARAGCLSGPSDYRAAALIFQHGELPAHFRQAYEWARRAEEQDGAAASKELVALTIDRYLVSTGQKQLFGTQKRRTGPKGECLCLLATENELPDTLRKSYTRLTLADEIAQVRSGSMPQCALYCDEPLQSNPRGSVPGLW